ncbi:MAG: glycosyltransferase family 2 protein [Lentisphaeria bacterium]|jgi:glycosyltransferase involved in cell wall biosynthesis
MRFSIITVCFNSAETIRKTFESILAQSFLDYEYIVIDGASSDGTVDIILEYEPKFQGRMRWISEPDKGIYDAMNKGIRLAKGDYINFMNSDDFFEDGALKVTAQTIARNPDADVCYGYVRIIPSMRVRRCTPEFLTYGPQCHQGTFVARKVFERYGGFDMQYRLAADYEHSMRMRKNNLCFIPLDKIVANYYLGGASTKQREQTLAEINAIRIHYGVLKQAEDEDSDQILWKKLNARILNCVGMVLKILKRCIGK